VIFGVFFFVLLDMQVEKTSINETTRRSLELSVGI
jgi:hypothetical protein